MRHIVLCVGRYCMDIQTKRGLLDVCVLAAIKDHDSYGYQIIKDLSPYVEISESTLYPILRRLEESRMLQAYSIEHNGRLRKYFRITNAGLKRIDDFYEDWKEILEIYRFIMREREKLKNWNLLKNLDRASRAIRKTWSITPSIITPNALMMRWRTAAMKKRRSGPWAAWTKSSGTP